jgi:hypothetical protein
MALFRMLGINAAGTHTFLRHPCVRENQAELIAVPAPIRAKLNRDRGAGTARKIEAGTSRVGSREIETQKP